LLDAFVIGEWEQASALLHPGRRDVLRQLAEPRSCADVAAVLGLTPQRVNYHIQILLKNKLAERVGEQRVRALTGGIYQATARTYWLSAGLVDDLGGRRSVGEGAAHEYLHHFVADLQSDLAGVQRDTPTIAIGADVVIDPAARSAFLERVETAIKEIAAEYGRSDACGERFRLRTIVYGTVPATGEESDR
jgi:DNA-binding transcriptional ArsR family regulator